MAKESTQAELTVTKTMQMGLGEALQRLMKVELLLQKGIAVVPENTRAERQLIIEALNTHKLDLGFDCNLDGVPDTVEIFAKSAETACCKIVTTDTSRTSKPVSSRRKPAAKKATAKKDTATKQADDLLQAVAQEEEKALRADQDVLKAAVAAAKKTESGKKKASSRRTSRK